MCDRRLVWLCGRRIRALGHLHQHYYEDYPSSQKSIVQTCLWQVVCHLFWSSLWLPSNVVSYNTQRQETKTVHGQCLLGQAHYEGVGHCSDRLVCYKLSHTPWAGGSFERGCAAGTPESSAYTTPGSAEFCYPIQGSTLRPVGWPMRPAFTQWRPNFYAWLPIWPPG